MKWGIAFFATLLVVAFFLWPSDSPSQGTLVTAPPSTPGLPRGQNEGELKNHPALEPSGNSLGVSADSLAENGAVLRNALARNIRFLDSNGSLLKVPIEFFLVKVNEELESRMSTFARVGQSLWGNACVFEYFNEAAPGAIAIPSNLPAADFVMAFAEGYAPYLSIWEPLNAGQSIDITLDSVEPIKVKITDPNGNPLEGAQAWINYGGTFNHSNASGILSQLKQRFFQQGYETDENGEVTIPTCFEGPHNEILFVPGALWGSEVFLAESGDSLNYVALPGFALKGRVTLNHKTPDREIFVKVYDRNEGGFSQLTSGRVQEDGSYTVEGILVLPGAVDISATGDGIALNFHTIVNPPVNGVVTFDLDLELGAGGSLRLTTPWGEPIVDAKVKLRRSKEQPMPFSYRTDESGLIEFPMSFPKDDSFRISVQIDDLIFTPSDLFASGKDHDVVIPNLATIDEVTLDSEILGDATLTTLYWIPFNSVSKGYAGWQGAKNTSPLLAAGNGSLRMGVSDGRWFGKTLFLEEGESQSVDLGLTPATILCDVGSSLARVRLVSADGAFAFEAKDVSGAIEIPCWQGNFFLHVWWEGEALTIPPFQVVSPVLDLGALQAGQLHDLYGTVTYADGRPAENANVSLFGLYGADGRSAHSDENGDFTLTQIQEGRHHLICSAPSLGSFATTVTSTVIVSHGFPPPSLDVILPLAATDGEVIGLSKNFNTGANIGFLISAGTLQSKEITSSHSFSFSAQATQSWLGAFHSSGTQTFAFAKRISEGPGHFDLSTLNGTDFMLSLVDEFQTPHRDLLVRLELDGESMPSRITLDQSGSHRFTLNAELPWEFSIRTHTGYERRIALAELNGQPIVIPRSEQMRKVRATEQDGSSIVRFSVQDSEGRLFFSCKAQGIVEVPVSCTADLFATAPGKIPCWINGGAAVETVVLPDAITGLSVEVAAGLNGAASLQWRSDIDCASVWGRDGLEATTPGATVGLPPIPAGGLKLEILNVNGAVLATKRLETVEPGKKFVIGL